MQRTVLVTGANRGIGLAVCEALAAQGHEVWVSARNVEAGQRAAADVSERTGRLVRFVPLDLADPISIEEARATLGRAGFRVEILVNNGAVLHRGNLLQVSDEKVVESFSINVHGALHCIRSFAPDMIQAGWGRIVNVSSWSGSFAGGLAGPAAYAITKAALNAMTLSAAHALPDFVKINAVSPGWVRTDMGGEAAPRSLEQGAAGVVWAATLPDDGPTGGFFRDGEPVPW